MPKLLSQVLPEAPASNESKTKFAHMTLRK
jgi:hypothetical protein